MKTLTVPFIPQESLLNDIKLTNAIDNEPWNKNGKPSCNAAFSITHFNGGLCIKYSVTEPLIKVKKRKINGPVHKDNCVEFFIAFDNDKSYYNFEFNCLGNVKAAFGKGRQQRKFLPAQLLKPIQDGAEICINSADTGGFKWTLTVTLPLSIFVHHKKQSFSGLNCLANFAKCGDDLPLPHFLSWVNINAATPDFHQPAFFGKLIFETNEHLI